MSKQQAQESNAQPDDLGVAGARVAASVTTASHLLVAEDNRLNSLLMQEQLRMLGFSAEIVATGDEALRRWRSGAFAALLTDIQMPGMDGYELARIIRAEEGDRARMPIIALTAHVPSDKAALWRAAGIDDCLMKPAELPTLKATLQRWLRSAAVDAPVPRRSELPAAAGDPVDPGALARTVGDDPVVLADFMASFARSANDAATGLEAALAAGDLGQVGSIAHQLKSSSRAVGAARLGDLCNDLEVAAAKADDPALTSSWLRFQSEFRLVASWLSARGASVVAPARPLASS
jgi:CheY-like chemotaxis protein/HPt (histidine-containing phosphotransfer) domain-containing protein